MEILLVLILTVLPVVLSVLLLFLQLRRRALVPRRFGEGGGGRWRRRGLSGDREPRRPLRPAGAATVTMPEPRSQPERIDVIGKTLGDSGDGSSGAVA